MLNFERAGLVIVRSDDDMMLFMFFDFPAFMFDQSKEVHVF